jgi:hypothetical protein
MRTPERAPTGRAGGQQRPAMARAARYLRHIPPRPSPGATRHGPFVLLDVRSQAVRADAREVAAVAEIPAAADKLSGEKAPLDGLDDRVVEQCFERNTAESGDIIEAPPALHIANEVSSICKRHLPRKFETAFAAVPQGKSIEQRPARLERRRPHA